MKPVLLVGTGTTAHRQDHQRDMYAPAIAALADDGFSVVGVWVSGSERQPTGAGSRAAALAADAGVEVFTDLAAALATCAHPHQPALAVVCADPAAVDELDTALSLLTEAGVPTVIDKPTLLPTADLARLAEKFSGVVAGHCWRSHPAVAGARGRVLSGSIGLLHAIHGELIVGPKDGPHPSGELRNLAVHALDVVQSLVGDLHGRAAATIAPAGPDGAGEAITISLRLLPDIAVTLLIGRSGAGTAAEPQPPVPAIHRYRVLGSHGQLLLDLDSPAMDIVGGQPGRLPFGPNAVALHLQAAAAGAGQPGLGVAAHLAGVIDALDRAAQTHQAVDI